MLQRLLAGILCICVLAGTAFAGYDPSWGNREDWTEEQIQEALDTWTDADWDAYYKDQRAIWLKDHGLTELEGYNVRINDTCVTFGEQKPIVTEDGLLLPFRAMFAALGATITYRADTREAIAAFGETRVRVMEGENIFVVEGANGSQTKKSEIAPCQENGGMYIPYQLFADATGYDVFEDWMYDGANNFEIMNFTDVAALSAKINEDFSLFNRATQEIPNVDKEKTYRTISDFKLEAMLYREKNPDIASISGKITTLSKGSLLNVAATLALDLDDLSDVVQSQFDAETIETLKSLRQATIEMIWDRSSGACYVKSPVLGSLGYPVEPGAWYQTTFYGINPAIFGGMQAVLLMVTNPYQQTVGDLVYQMIYNQYSLYGESPWNVALEAKKSLSAQIGDQAFTQKNGRYSIRMDRDTLLEQVYEGEELAQQKKNIPNASYELVMVERDGRFAEIVWRQSAADLSQLIEESSFSLVRNAEDMDFQVVNKGRYLGKITFGLKSKTSESSESLRDAPPEGAVVVKEEQINIQEPTDPAKG